MLNADNKIKNRLKRAEGQLRGIQNMLENEKPCVDIVTQLSAVRSSVDRIIGIIVAENLKECLIENHEDEQVQKEKIQEAIQMIIKK